VNGATNPNFGRPYFASDSIGKIFTNNRRKAFRATTYATLDLTQKSGLLRHLGKHTVTGVYSDLESSSFFRSYQGYSYTTDLNAYANNPAALTYPDYAAIHYLGGSLANRTSAAGAGIQGLDGAPRPADHWHRVALRQPHQHLGAEARPSRSSDPTAASTSSTRTPRAR